MSIYRLASAKIIAGSFYLAYANGLPVRIVFLLPKSALNSIDLTNTNK